MEVIRTLYANTSFGTLYPLSRGFSHRSEEVNSPTINQILQKWLLSVPRKVIDGCFFDKVSSNLEEMSKGGVELEGCI